MALQKDITADNGIVTNYHRIESLYSRTNDSTTIGVNHYINETWRQREKERQHDTVGGQIYISTDYLSIPFDPTMSIITAYDYLKTLPEYADSTDVLDGAQTGTLIDVTSRWVAGRWYTVGEQVIYDGSLYVVVQAHTSQEGWEPSKTPALFSLVCEGKAPDPSVILPWIQPTGAHNAYNIGDKVTHVGRTWESTVNANVWEPGSMGADELWNDITPEPEPEPTPEPTVPEWVQPTGAGDAYMLDDHVMHNGVEWVSIVDNNTWEPGVYGWSEVVVESAGESEPTEPESNEPEPTEPEQTEPESGTTEPSDEPSGEQEGASEPEIPEWVQPTGAGDAYNIGDRVTFNGTTYESTINGNTWSPTVYPQGWQEI